MVRLVTAAPAQILLTLSVLLGAWCNGHPSACAQHFLVLGQSPPGPLLDDGTADNWLEQAPNPAPGGSLAPGTVTDGGFATNGMSPSDSMAGAGDNGWPADAASVGHLYGEPVPYPDDSIAGCINGGFAPLAAPGLYQPGACGPSADWQGLLQPMTRESWLYRPFSAGWFMGFMQGSELVEDWVGQGQGFFGGYRFGWDFDPYWGCETRFGFASVALYDSQRAQAAQSAADLASGLTTNDAIYHRFDTRRDSGIRMWDVDMLWYPYGDSYLRPYVLLGLGTARVDFMDRLSERRTKSVLAVPIAMGVKYRVRDWLALRIEAADNFIAGAGSGFKNLNNFSLTAGLEVRFGGTRTGYWPYYPGRHYW